MNDGLKIQRCNFLPEGEMVIVKDANTLIHNIVDSELKEKDKEIERLNNIINGKFAIICNEKMIDKLSATEMIVLQEKEIKRLNNIINELEKDLTKILEDMYNSLVHIDGRGYYSASLVPLEDELNKLKEFKGSDKDENNK